ncbi:Bardet-Biedl syndrome 4 protein [Coccinella septempunctata]|uniref:Bardet-Biedl syndrome 4 protein n=1 Tax=Coccinella septempunctata TaxID=41139 RepID=UPI001D0950AC|nr:Bardet-Biedl syndrome 4 protein [Coccinella septempunctata]
MSLMLNGHKHISVSTSAKRTPVRYSEPAPFEKLNWLIHLLHVRGDTGACRELIEDEIDNTGGRNEFLYYKKGLLLRNEGRISEALEAFQICLRISPDNPDNIMEIGSCLFELKRYKLALDAYKEAERISNSPDWQIFHRIAMILLLNEDIDGAKDYVRKAVEHGKNEISYALLVRILKEERDFKSALAVCRTAIESCPDSLEMMCEAGFLHLRLGEDQHAFERFSDALAFNPYCSKALLGIGYVTQSHGEIDVALSKYKSAIQFQPNSVALWNNIGICFHSLQKHIASMSCLKRALWMAPLNWKILFNLGLVHLSIHQQASAFNFLCAAVNLRPDAAGVFNALGCSLMELQDPVNALRAFNQASLLAPHDINSILNATLCLALIGDLVKFHQNMQEIGEFINSHPNVPKETTELYNQLTNVPPEALSLSANEGSSTMKPNAITKDGTTKKGLPEKSETRGISVQRHGEMASDEV